MVVVGAVLALAVPATADWQAGVNAYRNGDYATAIKEFEQVTQTNPDYAGAYYMLGLAQKGAGKVSAALANARKAVSLDEGNVSYKVFLGQVLVQAEQFREGYTTLKGVPVSSVDAKMRSGYVLVYAKAATKSGHASEAIGIIDNQIKADANNASLYQALGEAYGETGNDKERFKAFQKAFQINPKDQGSGLRAAHAAIAVARRTTSAQEKIRYYTDAAKIAEGLATLSSTFDHMLLAGEAWLGAKRYSEALEWFGKAKQKKPRNALVCFYRGQAYSSLEKFSDSLKELQEALAIGADDSKLRQQIYNQMGYVYAKQKEYEKAKHAYAEAGNSSKVNEMNENIAQANLNRQAEQEQAEYEKKLAGLRMQIQELRKIGENAEADSLHKQLDELETHK
jgi:tetratricopeptide (TPR) repeat protein